MSEENEGLEPSSAIEQDDFLNMSDDDFMGYSEPDAADEPEQSEGEGEQLDGEDSTEEELYGNGEEASDGDSGDEETTEASSTGDDPFNPEEDSNGEDESDGEGGTEAGDESGEPADQSTEQDGLDFKAKYEELLAPFKANGKDIKVDNAEDLRRLAQMGVGYNAKMAALKPVRKIAKMLENEGLLDEAKISFLIDLSKNNPDAINKLVKESGINPLDINTESTDGYTPETYTVDDRQLDLDEALADLKQSPTFKDTLDVVSNKWDEASRRVLVDNPQALKDIDSHMQSGVYEQVMTVVDRERLMGRLPSGVSDLQAYEYVGKQMEAQGSFGQAQTQAPIANASTKQPNPKPKDVQRNVRRRAAGATSSKPATQKAQPESYLNLSDSEFEKLMPKYM